GVGRKLVEDEVVVGRKGCAVGAVGGVVFRFGHELHRAFGGGLSKPKVAMAVGDGFVDNIFAIAGKIGVANALASVGEMFEFEVARGGGRCVAAMVEEPKTRCRERDDQEY